MEKLDLKDRRILYHLDLNCRQSNAQIGKKVALSREMVNYRIKRMEEKEIITGYWTAINTYKFGYYVFRIYLNLINVSKKSKNELIDYFMKNKNAWAVLTAKGPVDLDIVLWVKDVYEFNRYWIKTLQKYGNYFSKDTISILTDVMSCKKSYLINGKDDPSKRLLYRTNCGGEPLKIDKTDFQILDELALNARIPLIDLATKLEMSSQTINYRIKNMMKNGIIQAFRINVDPLKLGLQTCCIDLYLKDQTKRKKILDYIIKHPNIFDIMIMNIGWSDLAFQINIENMGGLSKIIDEIETKFPDSIRKYDYWMDQKGYMERWLPDLTEKDSK